MDAAGFVLGCLILIMYLYVTDLIDYIKDKRQINRKKHILHNGSKNKVIESIIPLNSK